MRLFFPLSLVCSLSATLGCVGEVPKPRYCADHKPTSAGSCSDFDDNTFQGWMNSGMSVGSSITIGTDAYSSPKALKLSSTTKGVIGTSASISRQFLSITTPGSVQIRARLKIDPTCTSATVPVHVLSLMMVDTAKPLNTVAASLETTAVVAGIVQQWSGNARWVAVAKPIPTGQWILLSMDMVFNGAVVTTSAAVDGTQVSSGVDTLAMPASGSAVVVIGQSSKVPSGGGANPNDSFDGPCSILVDDVFVDKGP